MIVSREDFQERLLKSYTSYYNINRIEDENLPLLARCDFHVENSSYVLLKRNVTWSAMSHEYCYIFSVSHLTPDLYRQMEKYVYDNGMALIDPKKENHMSTSLTLLVICDTCDRDAEKALKHCHIHKEFRLGLDGWMDFHTALVCIENHRVFTNMSGHANAKHLKQMLRLAPSGAEMAATCAGAAR